MLSEDQRVPQEIATNNEAWRRAQYENSGEPDAQRDDYGETEVLPGTFIRAYFLVPILSLLRMRWLDLKKATTDDLLRLGLNNHIHLRKRR